MTITQEQIAALVKKLRSQIGDDVQHIYDHEALFKLSADMLEQLAAERNTCPLGDDCDLTVAWMAGQQEARDRIRALSAALQAAEAENARLRDALNDTAEHLYVAAAEGLASRYDGRLDAFRRARALLTGKDDGWEETLQIASNAADDAHHS